MLKNVLDSVCARRHFLIGACLLAALTALPAFAVQNSSIKLSLNASFNGYTVESSDNGLDVSLVGVHGGTSKSSPILNGSHEVTVTLSNKKQVKKSLSFTDGTAEFGAVGPVDSGTKVSAVGVIAPMY